MGIYIGTQQNPVEVKFTGGVKSTEAYLGLTDDFNIRRDKRSGNFKCRIGLEVFYSEDAKVQGESSLYTSELPIVEIDITEQEWFEAITTNIASFMLIKLIAKLEELVPTWKDKLFVNI